jgi:hypothetical protein
MDELFHWLWMLFLLFLHWLWSIRDILLFMAGFFGLCFWFKSLVNSAVKEALKETVVPLLTKISEQRGNQSRAYDDDNEDEDDDE